MTHSRATRRDARSCSEVAPGRRTRARRTPVPVPTSPARAARGSAAALMGSRRWPWATCFLAGLVLTAGCTSSTPGHPSAHPASPGTAGQSSPGRPSASLPSTPAALASFYSQRPTWTLCDNGYECASIRVPLDYTHPHGRSIRVAVLKAPATDTKRRLGSLVVNPGGPGISGVDYAAASQDAFGTDLLQRYDIVGFDPRGVGSSTALHCASDATLNAFVNSDPSPDTRAEARRNGQIVRGLGKGCLSHDAGLARHVSTLEVARDMDVLRGVLDEPRLTYLGQSYGTLLGATYAHLFPTHVARMVLDGAIDPQASTVAFALAQARGFDGELTAYLRWCTQQHDCPAGTTMKQATRWMQGFLRRVDKAPIPSTAGGHLTIGTAVTGIQTPLYDESRWGELSVALASAAAGDGRPLRFLADESLHRNGGGTFDDNVVQANAAMWCADHDDAVRPRRLHRYQARFVKAAPTLGPMFAASTAFCAWWPVHTGRHPGPMPTTRTPPIMVIGTTHDPATPLTFAKALARQLPDSILVTRTGHGHTAYRTGNPCVDHAAEAYLLGAPDNRHHISC